MKTPLLYCVLLGCALLASSCGGPTGVERDNRRALDAILTAITIKNARLLEDDARRAKARYDAGHFRAEQYQALEAIIEKARAGDWSGAEADGYVFRKRHPFVKDGQ
jgi:hypothetical protein